MFCGIKRFWIFRLAIIIFELVCDYQMSVLFI